MTKRLCPDTDQNCVQTVPKYAVAPEAEAIRSHYVHQNFYFSFYCKIVDRNQRKVPVTPVTVTEQKSVTKIVRDSVSCLSMWPA